MNLIYILRRMGSLMKNKFMRNFRVIIPAVALLILFIFGFLYAKRKYFEPKIRIKEAKQEVEKLSNKNEIRTGDIIFQTSLSSQSKAIQLATHSEYSHCGIIFKEN